jgi:cytochrome P450
MSLDMLLLPSWLLAGFITIYAAIYWLSTRPLDAREPPIVPSGIPYLGHLLGMVLQGGRYVKEIGLRYSPQKRPIFTLVVPNSRMYIVTDPGLAAVVQRSSRALSFTPVIPEVTERIFGLDKATKAIASKNLDPGPHEIKGFLAEIQEMTYAWLGPGEYLGQLTLDAVRDLKNEVENCRNLINSSADGTDTVNLLSWIQRLVTISTAKYLYGPDNPIARDPNLVEAFWDFDHGLGLLLLNMFPAVTAPRAWRGREKLVAALAEYLESGTYKTGSKIIQERVRIALKHGWTLKTAAREELSFLFAGIVNATTSTFWTVLQIFANPDLLVRVRDELHNIVHHEDGTDVHTLAIDDLRNKCPLLVAVYRECLRLNSDNNSIRVVKETTLLADRWYIAKGSIVQIAGGIIHADPSVWGPNVDKFDPIRFLGGHGGDTEKRTERQYHPAAFRAFGGGKTLCPGRHFAMSEILSLVALIILQFDIDAPNGGKIRVPKKNDAVLPVHILEPAEPVEVLLRPRNGKTFDIISSRDS